MLRLAALLVALCAVAFGVNAAPICDTCTPPTEPSPSPSPSAPPERPNIVVVICDDCGIATMDGVPQIDQLKAQGTTLDIFYSNTLCSPGRASLLSGRVPKRDGVPNGEVYTSDNPESMPESVVTLGHVLTGAGYDTAWIGKSHEGRDPYTFGFTYDFSHRYAISDVSKRVTFRENGTIALDYPTTDTAQFKRITRQTFGPALAWLASGRDPAKPFFLVVAPDMVHQPLQCEVKIAGEQLYKCATRELGNWIGTLRAALPGNTLFFFTSDNGSYDVTHHWNGTLRGAKDSNNEGGLRVPFIGAGPGIPAGVTVDTPAAIWDLLPTLAGLAGAAVPSDRVIDGRDIWPLLTGTGERGDGVFTGWWEGAYREGCLKWNASALGGAVFDLCADPNETTAIPSLKTAWKAKWKAATPALGL